MNGPRRFNLLLAILVSLAFGLVGEVSAQPPMSERNVNITSKEYVTLKEYVDMRFREMERTIDLSRISMEHRLAGMNEFREALNKQTSTFLTKAEFDTSKENFQKDIKLLTQAKDQMDGKATQNQMIAALIISIISLLIALGGLLRHFKV